MEKRKSEASSESKIRTKEHLSELEETCEDAYYYHINRKYTDSSNLTNTTCTDSNPSTCTDSSNSTSAFTKRTLFAALWNIDETVAAKNGEC